MKAARQYGILCLGFCLCPTWSTELQQLTLTEKSLVEKELVFSFKQPYLQKADWFVVHTPVPTMVLDFPAASSTLPLLLPAQSWFGPLEQANDAARLRVTIPYSLGLQPSVSSQDSQWRVQFKQVLPSQHQLRHVLFHANGRTAKLTFEFDTLPLHCAAEKQGRLLKLKWMNAAYWSGEESLTQVNAFFTPLSEYELGQEGEQDLVWSAQMREDFNYLMVQQDNTATVYVFPEEVEAAQRDNHVYQGKPISVNFQNIDVRSVLQTLADLQQFNLVLSEQVTGQLSLRLEDVSWDQALDLILRTQGLDKRIEGNVMWVASSEEIAKNDLQRLNFERELQSSGRLKLDFIQINYARANDVAKLLKTGDSRLLSERGQVTVDERTNQLLIQDTSEQLEAIRQLVQKLDIPIQQVLIEARIVNVQEDMDKNLGLDWKLTGQKPRQLPINSAGNNFAFGLPENTDVFHLGQLGWNGGILNSAVAVATLPKGLLLGLELKALASESLLEELAHPRLLTANRQEALIRQGTQVPYAEESRSGGTTVQFRPAVLELRVLPQITPDGRVILTLNVKNDTVSANTVGAIPLITTKEISTQVVVKNGETIVLGGIFSQDKADKRRRVPFLSDIPILGSFFSQREGRQSKKELLIFVTPHIVLENRDSREG